MFSRFSLQVGGCCVEFIQHLLICFLDFYYWGCSLEYPSEIIKSFSGILLSAAGRGKGDLVSSFHQKLLTDYELIRLQPSETIETKKLIQ